MFKYTIPIILIIIAILGLFMFVDPLYKQVSLLRAQTVSYNQALDNSKTLEAERDKLTEKYNTIDPNNLAKLQTFLPDNVDNIRLILEIEKVATPYGMVLKNVKYDTTTNDTTTDTTAPSPTDVIAGGTAATPTKDYGTWNLEFSTTGSYSNFVNFLKDLESNLRIVDIASIQFSSDTPVNPGINTASSLKPSDSYNYDFKIKTYWLKN